MVEPHLSKYTPILEHIVRITRKVQANESDHSYRAKQEKWISRARVAQECVFLQTTLKLHIVTLLKFFCIPHSISNLTQRISCYIPFSVIWAVSN